MNQLSGYKQKLSEFLKFQTVSTNKKFSPEIKKAVVWLKKLLAKNGFRIKIWQGKTTNPLIFAHFHHSNSLKTVLIYGHYDVQPAQKADGWRTDPFTLTEKDGRLWGRGVVDNKGQILIHLFTIIQLIKAGKLNYNVKFLLEGNEETGSQGLDKIIKQQQKLLKANVVLISDGEMPYQPSLTASFRGTFNLAVKLTTAKTDLHSGLFGGVVPNPIHQLAKVIAKLYKTNHQIAVPGFYQGLAKPRPQERQQASQLDNAKIRLLKKLGSKNLVLETGQGLSSQIGMRPMITSSGINGGYTGEGYANIIPAQAQAKLNIRLPANQQPQKLAKHLEKFIKKQLDPYGQVKVISEQFCQPVKLNLNSVYHQRAKELLEQVYEKEVLIDYCGATIPLVQTFKKVLKLDPVMVPLANDDCNMHGANENFDLELLEKGLRFSRAFFSTTTKINP